MENREVAQQVKQREIEDNNKQKDKVEKLRYSLWAPS